MVRPVGTREISLDAVEKIIDLTLSKHYSRPEIARRARVSVDTVYRYQKKYDLI